MKFLCLIIIVLAFHSFSFADEIKKSIAELDLEASEESMYYQLRAEYRNRENTVPTYDDFHGIDEEEGRNCIEVKSEKPDADYHMGVYLFVKRYANRGPLFPAKTINKVIVHRHASFESTFDRVTNEFTDSDLISEFEYNDENKWKTYIRERDDLLFFRRKGKDGDDSFEAYGYCYSL